MARIVMIDDDGDFVASLKVLLESNGHTVFAAGNGRGGLALVKEVEPDLILLDVMMDTRIEGFHVSRVLRERVPGAEYAAFRHVPILMLTSIHERTKMRFGPDDDYLPVDVLLDKSERLDVILEKVRTLLARAARARD